VGESGSVVEPAPAKLNLFLRVAGRRPDGYHDIETVILPLTLVDHVTVQAALGEAQVSLTVRGAHSEGVHDQEDNLAVRAAVRLQKLTGRRDGVVIDIDKRIPVAAGLGGGSADAAAVLRALDRLWGLGLGPQGLTPIAAQVGSDVPALLWNAPVLARGRGDSVQPIEVPTTNWVLVTQPFGVSAGDAYRWWDEDGAPSGPQPRPVIDALRAGDIEVLHGLLFNDLERPVIRRHPEVAEATRALLEAGSLATIMCGSGPTVAGLCRDAGQAAEIAAATGGLAVSTVTGSTA
jgi:4-diphosphocytidyl-2-C-methyl-D-erythritol kinase